MSTGLDVLAPINTVGEVSNTSQTSQIGDDAREWRHHVTGTVNADTYIWQPWFARTQGTLNLSREVATGGTAGTTSTTGSGTVALSLLPVSLYPTAFSYSRNQSTADGTLFTSSTTSNRMALSSRMFLPDQYSAGINLSTEQTAFSDGGENTSRDASVEVNKPFEWANVSLALRHNEEEYRTESSTADVTGTTDIATFRNDSEPFDDMFVQSTSTLLLSKSETVTTNRDVFSIQGVSNAQWRPEQLPFTINGAMRTLTEVIGLSGPTSAGSADTETTFALGTLGVNYPIVPRLTANAGLTANYQDVVTSAGASGGEALVSAARQTRTAGALAGLNYNSLPVPVIGFDWNWNSATSGQMLMSINESGQQSATQNLGHSINRSLGFLSFMGPVTFKASESGAVSFVSNGASVPVAGHNASLTRNFETGGTRSFIRLSASDRRDIAAAQPNVSQLILFQANQTSTIDLDSGWQVNLSIQSSRQQVGDEEGGFVTTLNGTAEYSRRRLFAVADLTFRSTLTLNAIGFESFQEDTGTATTVRTDWRNLLNYRIGLVIMSVEARVFRDRGAIGDIVLFRLRRLFG